MFNLVNQSNHIYTEGGSVPNTRLHILFVAFPGFGKSFFLRQFLEDDKYSFLKGSTIPTVFEGTLTEAGLIGKVETNKETGEPMFTHGLCRTESSSIIGMEEFSSVTNAMKQQWNSSLDTSLLLALDSGNVVKRLGGGKIDYHTNITMWAGVQPSRYDLGSGFARRFAFLTFYPTMNDIHIYRESRRKTKHINVPKAWMGALKLALETRAHEIKTNLKRVQFSEDFYIELDKYDNMHYEDELFERIAIGYWLMKSERIGDQLYITMDSELRRLINLEHEYRDNVNTYSPVKALWNLIKNEKKVTKSKLYKIMITLGFEEYIINDSLHKLFRAKKIKEEGNEYIIL